ncbi:MAG: F0F1 ATP synthase subunit B [Bacteroidaceae bacterium]|jgi:F-type H+-transporting ATPase subunit b|nr:F0F1 ATP synthase subunit B [Bacteroidaceae bacterium]
MSLLLPDAGLLFWMLLAFGVVFFVLYKWGFPVITSMIDARKRYIDDALNEAKEAKAKLAGVEEECNALVNEARENQAKILREAVVAKEQIISDARDKAAAETEMMISEAKKQIERERDEALNSIRTEVAKLSIAIAEKIVRKELEESDRQQRYIDELVDETMNGRKG